MIEHLGLSSQNWNPAKVAPCKYVSDGEEVVAVIKGEGRLVIVDTACGHHARIVTRGGESYWRNVSDLARLKATK